MRHLPYLVKNHLISVLSTWCHCAGVTKKKKGIYPLRIDAQHAFKRLALAAGHKREAFKQVHVLFVFQQRAVQFGQGSCAGFQIFGCHVFGQQ
jgi:hypothetical protein